MIILSSKEEKNSFHYILLMLVWFYGAHWFTQSTLFFNVRVGVTIFIYNMWGFRCRSLSVILPVQIQFVMLLHIIFYLSID